MKVLIKSKKGLSYDKPFNFDEDLRGYTETSQTSEQ